MIADLTEARRLIADPARWTQRALARNDQGAEVSVFAPRAVCFCAVGAVAHTTRAAPRSGDVNYRLSRAAHRLFGLGIVEVNDTLGHAAVLRAYDEAIASARISNMGAPP